MALCHRDCVTLPWGVRWGWAWGLTAGSLAFLPQQGGGVGWDEVYNQLSLTGEPLFLCLGFFAFKTGLIEAHTS